ncbi:hypothetical protein [Aurantiacibacter aquimixticola]|uniref:Uncharacterized protein n=1 Tax=Aurantiacibacter aquimixticola TaxID=1958945 RepID=A0A419RVZ8_9SPHN|nr:hypothetical protein [Aurantiacibacter aquimixticola]RJY09951.1 hypothetical protein D6201_11870 [Aurantiacibacter aquimixticola]
MKVSPWILGAAVIVPVAGALAGSNIGTDPIIVEDADISASLPDGEPIEIVDAAPQTRDRMPDHYAMETPEGRVEVEELAWRGRYAERAVRIDAYDAASEAEMAAIDAELAALEDPSRQAVMLNAQQPRIDPADRRAVQAPSPAREPQIANYAAMERQAMRERAAMQSEGAARQSAPREQAASRARTIEVEAILTQ